MPAPPHAFALEADRLAYGRFARASSSDRCELEYREHGAVELPPETFLSGPLGGPLRDPAAFRGACGALLERISAPVEEASLVLPDAWLRLSFTEAGELPRRGPAREEVLRWKLRRLVPFRVDELRLRAVEVEPLPRQEEPRRLLLAFAIELLLAQLEEAFSALGVRLGQITNQSLALRSALARTLDPLELGGLVVVRPDGYTLLFTRRGEPVLHRFKALDAALPEAARRSLVIRDLRLTGSFLAEQLDGVRPARMVVAAAEPEAARWRSWLAEGLEAEGEVLDGRHLPLRGGASGAGWRELAPLVGAACQEVA